MKQAKPTELVLFGAHGEPIRTVPAKKEMGLTPAFSSQLNNWFSSLSSTRLPALVRAQDPFQNHAWVFAAAMTSAVAASQAPFTVFIESPEYMNMMDMFAARVGRVRTPGLRYGKDRTVTQRRVMRPWQERAKLKGLDPDYEHPIMKLLANPNPLQHGNQLLITTYLWLEVRGECFWVKEYDESGKNLMRLWPLSPDLFEPMYADGNYGELVGWWYCPPPWMRSVAARYRYPLTLDEVVQFKYPNPTNPIRGLSRIGAVAASIESDMLSKEYNRAILENGGDPGGVITYDSTLTKEEQEEYLGEWDQDHGGTNNARRTAILQGGFKYTPVAVTPKDIEFLKSMEWNREEVLAAMGVSSSVLGAKDVANYAVAMAQELHFWTKNVIPMLQLIETTLDATLFYTEPDNVVGVHDLKNVEALRAGIADKVGTAVLMTGRELKMPPRVAFEVLGMEVPAYEGDDVNGAPAPAPLPGLPGAPPPPTPVPPGTTPEDVMAIFNTTRKMAVLKASRWEQFVKVQSVIEDRMRKRYKRWARDERTVMLEWWDKMTEGGKALDLAVTVIAGIAKGKVMRAPALLGTMPNINNSKAALKAKFRPLYSKAMQDTLEFTVTDIGGMPVIDISSPKLIEFFNLREKTFVNSTPETIRRALMGSLTEGVQLGETVQQLRGRIAEIYDIASSSPKSLQVARTESGSFMNGVRDQIFDAQGVEEEEWSTAGDEVVRWQHVVFGDAGALKRGYNYLELVDEQDRGKLEYPGDTRCSNLGLLINCRCLKIPV